MSPLGEGSPLFTENVADLPEGGSRLGRLDDGREEVIGGLGGTVHNNWFYGGELFGAWQDESRRRDGALYKADMVLGGGGFFAQYDYPVAPDVGISAGGMLGAGGLYLGAKGPDLGPDCRWSATEPFVMANPYVGLWLGPSNYNRMELDFGYMFFDVDTSDAEFQNDLEQPMVNGDLGGGYLLSLKILFGYWPEG